MISFPENRVALDYEQKNFLGKFVRKEKTKESELEDGFAEKKKTRA